MVNWKPLQHLQMSLAQSSELEVLAHLHGVVCHVQEVRNAESWRTGVWVHGFCSTQVKDMKHTGTTWNKFGSCKKVDSVCPKSLYWKYAFWTCETTTENLCTPFGGNTLLSFSARFIHCTHLLTFRRQTALELLVEEMFPLPVGALCQRNGGQKFRNPWSAWTCFFFAGGGGCKTNKSKSLVTSVVPPFPVTSLLEQLCQITSEVVASCIMILLPHWCSTNLHVSRNLPKENTRPSKQQHLLRYYFWSHLIFGLWSIDFVFPPHKGMPFQRTVGSPTWPWEVSR